MAVWFTADTHFGHAGALALYRRPFTSVAAMDAAMVARWNDVVRPDDEVWHLLEGGLVIDGYLIPEDESVTFINGKQNAVDVLTGSNKDEANFGICGPGAGVVQGGRRGR